MQERNGERAERDQPKQNESGARSDEVVERVGCIDVGIGDGCACRGEHARNMRLGKAGESRLDLAPPGPFACADQNKRDDGAEQDAGAGSEPALLDRLTHQEEAAKRERDAAGPDDPLRAEALFEACLGPCRFWHDRRSNRRLGFRRGRRPFFSLRLRRRGGERFRGGRRGRKRGGRRRFARKPGEIRFDPSKVELETLQPFAIAERHDETDDSEHRKGDHHGYESGEERVHHSGWGKKPMEGSRLPQSVRRSSVAALRPMVEASPVGRRI